MSGCSLEPEVDACTNFVREKIATPASLKIVSTSSVPSDGARIAGLTAADGVKLVSVEYDAENQYGASVRSSEYCAFKLTNGQLPSKSELESLVSSAVWDAKIRALKPIYSKLDEGGFEEDADAIEQEKIRYGCCLPAPGEGAH